MVVYSLICFGGKDGKTVTFTDAGDVVNLTNHGLRNGTGVVFTDNGNTLPTGLSKNTTYYAKQGADANKFTLWTTSDLTTQVTFSGTGSGTHKVKSAYYVGLSDKSRWTVGGTEYIFDSLSAWNTHRTTTVPASAFDTEVAEIGMGFTDINSSTVTISIPSAVNVITTEVNGVRSDGFHNGAINSGYIFEYTANANSAIAFSRPRNIVDGITVSLTYVGGTSQQGVSLSATACACKRNIFLGAGYGRAIYGSSALLDVQYNLVLGFASGIYMNQYGYFSQYANNTITKCAYGVDTISHTTSAIYGYFYNNVSIGNSTANWLAIPSNLDGATNNVGASGDTIWYKGSGVTYTATTSDFKTYGGSSWASTDDYHPAIGSVFIDYATEYYAAINTDIAGNEAPNYYPVDPNKRDLGAFEYDHGFGTTPQSQEVTVSGFASGSRISINKTDGTEIYNTDSPSWPQTTNYSTLTNVYIYIRAGSDPYYHPLKLSATIDPESGLTYDATGLQVEDIAASTYAAGVATDWSIDWDTGAITHSSGTTRYTVQDLYSYHQDESDTSTNIVKTPKMKGTTPRIFEMINDGDISDSDLEDLTGGSIEFQDGTLWSNLWTTDTMAAAHPVYIVQGTSKYTSFWADGSIDVLLKVKDAGTLIDSGLVTAYARPWGYTYANYTADLSGGGRNVAPLATLVDAAITETEATVGGWTDVTVSFGTYSEDFGDGDGSQTYYCKIDCNNRPLSEVYQRMQYLTRDVSTATLNGVEGWRYASAHTGYTANTIAPFGIYSGGIWAVAKGVWLDNVASADNLNYILTDDSGGTHQNTVALNQSVTIANVVTGSRVQIYDVTNSTELLNTTTAPYYWEDSLAPVGDRVIRVRISYVSGTSAKEFIEQTIGTCGQTQSTKDVTYLASQADDAVYNANAVDGSTVTGVTFTDSTTDKMNIDISAGSVELADLYAAWVYYASTEAGIRTDIDYIEAKDTSNYIYSNLIWKNTTSPSVPLKISGGYAWDSVTEDPIDLVDTTGGTIFLAPPHVVSKVVTVTGGNVITGDVSDILTATIDANITKVNGYTVSGDGQDGTEWGPA